MKGGEPGAEPDNRTVSLRLDWLRTSPYGCPKAIHTHVSQNDLVIFLSELWSTVPSTTHSQLRTDPMIQHLPPLVFPGAPLCQFLPPQRSSCLQYLHAPSCVSSKLSPIKHRWGFAVLKSPKILVLLFTVTGPLYPSLLLCVPKPSWVEDIRKPSNPPAVSPISTTWNLRARRWGLSMHFSASFLWH